MRFSAEAVVWLRLLTWGTLAITTIWFIVRPLFRRVTDEQVALYLEEHEPALEHGLASYQGGNWSAARDHLRSAVADNPDSAPTYLFLSVAQYELGEYDDANRALDAAERLDPSLAGQVAYRRGLLHFAQSHYAEAKVAFESAQARHRNVQHDDLGPVLLDLLENLATVTRLTRNLEVRLGLEEPPQTLSDDAMVIGNEN